jgi:hypothetical protein
MNSNKVFGVCTGRELASCTGERENSIALQALGVTGLCLQALKLEA